MNSTPPYLRSNPKSASRLARANSSLDELNQESPNLSLQLILPPSKSNDTPDPSPVSLRSSSSPVPLRELLLLSPSPLRKSRTRLADRLEMASEDAADPAAVVRKRGKTKGGQKSLVTCASPRNPRRSRKTSEAVEAKEDKEPNIVMEEMAKPRKRKTNGRSKKEKQSSAALLPSPCSSSDLPNEDACQSDLNRMGEIISDLVMWRDVAKSTLWFGLGCLCFLSSCFAKGVNFSFFSAISNLGLLLLCGSFLSNTLCQRKNEEMRREFHVSEDDVLRLARRVLPATNFAISKTSQLFSGEPSMTLKVIPFLIIGAEYGHLITLRRLCACGFFLSFTIPKLYSSYTDQISQKVERAKRRVCEAWGGCSQKKIVAGSAVTAFWNLASLRTRVFAAFIILVIVRYRRQNPQLSPDEIEPAETEKQQEETQREEDKPEQPLEEKQEQPLEKNNALVVFAETEVSKKL